jgi:membrane fusion protein (multidrug efflux system)
MVEERQGTGSRVSRRAVVIVGLAVVGILAGAAWFLLRPARESTDDAQVDAHLTPIAARVGGTVLRAPVRDNQQMNAGDTLVELDRRDYDVAVAKARAELQNGEAEASAARSSVPVTSTAVASNVTTAKGSVEEAVAAIEQVQKEMEAAHARLAAARARERELEANAAKAARDVERWRALLAKDEVSQLQFDATAATATAQRAAADSAKSQTLEAEAGISVAESRLVAARAAEQQARAALRSAETAPQQVAATEARAAAADAHVQQLKAALEQAELNLEYTVVRAPLKGVVSRKTAEIGQVVQAGQPLMALVPLEGVWITANFKETQVGAMRPGQRATVQVDAFGGHEFTGKVESIAAATGARFSLLPPENATGNFVKVVQRVPVKILLDEGQDPEHLLRPGMSVVPTVYTQ